MAATVLIIGCGDGRLKDPRRLLWLKLLFRKADFLTMPGSSACIDYSAVFDSKFDDYTHELGIDAIREQLHFYLSHHPITEIWVVWHKDCAFSHHLGHTKKGMTYEHDLQSHRAHYSTTLAWLRETFGLPVKLFFQTTSGSIRQIKG